MAHPQADPHQIDGAPDPEVGGTGRIDDKYRFRLDARLYHTDRPRPCDRDPELFFNPRATRRAIAQCRTCHFLGRCGYNAAIIGTTHGIWGGIMLPGNYPRKLARSYDALLRQFEQRRPVELPGETPSGETPSPAAPSTRPGSRPRVA
jgi:WhiB family transcriptional regulator, redox-sensing transcriptional regulator